MQCGEVKASQPETLSLKKEKSKLNILSLLGELFGEARFSFRCVNYFCSLRSLTGAIFHSHYFLDYSMHVSCGSGNSSPDLVSSLQEAEAKPLWEGREHFPGGGRLLLWTDCPCIVESFCGGGSGYNKGA